MTERADTTLSAGTTGTIALRVLGGPNGSLALDVLGRLVVPPITRSHM